MRLLYPLLESPLRTVGIRGNIPIVSRFRLCRSQGVRAFVLLGFHGIFSELNPKP